MKNNKKLLLAIVLTMVVTFITTAYFVNKNTIRALITRTIEMQAFNELHRVESWDKLEQLLAKGCNSEAHEYVKMEQSLSLLSLKDHIKNGATLKKVATNKSASIIKRANSAQNKGKYYIPSCN